MESEQSKSEQFSRPPSQPDQDAEHHLLKTGLGAAAGGVTGSLLGRAVGGKRGGMMGAIAGAVAGGLVGDAVADNLVALEQQAAEMLGEAPGEDELPAHYSWEQLQTLSKPQP
ncbi:MAG: glycine zipper domain-containing protein [Thermosynechococcaceae cyanobacterium]